MTLLNDGSPIVDNAFSELIARHAISLTQTPAEFMFQPTSAFQSSIEIYTNRKGGRDCAQQETAVRAGIAKKEYVFSRPGTEKSTLSHRSEISDFISRLLCRLGLRIQEYFCCWGHRTSGRCHLLRCSLAAGADAVRIGPACQ